MASISGRGSRSTRGVLFFSFFYLYALQGVPAGFALTTLTNYLIGQHLSPTAVSSFGAWVGLPWLCQFFWGPFIDKYKYRFGGDQKTWVMITQGCAFVASLLICAVSDPVQDITYLTAAFFLHSIFASVQDASVDALAITSMGETERGRVNAYMRGGFLIGISFGAVGLSLLLHAFGFRRAAMMQSLFILSGLLLTLFVKFPDSNRGYESIKHHSVSPPVKTLFRKLLDHFRLSSSLRFIALLGIIYSCFSVFSRSLTYYLLSDLQMPDKKLSVMQGSWGTVVTFAVMLGCGHLADRMGPKRLTRIVLLCTAVYVLGFCVISLMKVQTSFVLGGLLVWNFADPVMSIAIFPVVMSLSARYIEGSLFTCYMAFINFSDVLGNSISGRLLEHTDGRLIGLFCGVVLLAATTLLRRQTLLNQYSGRAGKLTEG